VNCERLRERISLVRVFGPIATELMRRNEMPLCAISSCEQMQQVASLLQSPRRRGQVDRYLDQTATVVAIVVAIV
jgi:hypothetical protein